MTAPTLGVGQIDLVVRLGRRRKGVTVPEVREHFDISHLAAWRAVQRLVNRGRLFVTSRTRRRILMFEDAGRGATVYKTKPTEEDNDE